MLEKCARRILVRYSAIVIKQLYVYCVNSVWFSKNEGDTSCIFSWCPISDYHRWSLAYTGSSRTHLAADAGFLGFFRQACSACYPHFCSYHTLRARGQYFISQHISPSSLIVTISHASDHKQCTIQRTLQFMFTMHWHAVGDRDFLLCLTFHLLPSVPKSTVL